MVQYSLSRPTREVLFTVISTSEVVGAAVGGSCYTCTIPAMVSGVSLLLSDVIDRDREIHGAIDVYYLHIVKTL